MSEFIKVIHNIETNKITQKTMTEEELSELQKLQGQAEAEKAAAEAKAAARQSALAKLAELGLTEEEIAAL